MEQLHKWADLFLNLPVQEMDPQTAEGFVMCSVRMMQTLTLDNLLADLRANFAIQVFGNRAKLVDLDIAGNAALFIASICESPGTLVMYVYAIRTFSAGKPHETRLADECVTETDPNQNRF